MSVWYKVYLFAMVTLLTIALRRVLRRQKPLNDALYSQKVAIEHVHSGIAWVRANGELGTVNPSLATTLNTTPEGLAGHDWYEIFPKQEREQVQEAYSQMLLVGKANFEGHARRADGTYAAIEVLLVAVHDHKMRFVGHHCLIADRTREHLLEEQLRELTTNRQRQTA